MLSVLCLFGQIGLFLHWDLWVCIIIDYTTIPQPLFYLGPEDDLEDSSAGSSADSSVDADPHTEVSSVSDAETESQAESMTEAIQSSVADIVSTCGYLSHPFMVPPPTPVTSAASTTPTMGSSESRS